MIRASHPLQLGGRLHAALPPLWSLVAVLTALAAFPLGLNRPVFWLSWGYALALIALWTLPRAHTLPKGIQGLLCLAALIPVYAVIQSLPLGLGWLVQRQAEIGLFPTASLSLLPSASALASVRWGIYVIFFIVTLDALRHDRARDGFALILYGSVVLQAVTALLTMRLVPLESVSDAYSTALTGPFLGRNAFASYLGMGLILGQGIMARLWPSTGRASVEHQITRLLCVASLAILFIALLQTQSRMGLVASTLGLLVSAALIVKPQRIWLFGIGLLALLLLGAGGLILSGALVAERAVYIQQAFAIRMELYQQILDLIALRPLTGFGLDCFRPAFELIHLPELTGGTIWDRAHSTYLTHWVELGLLIGSVPLVLGGIVAHKLLAAQSESATLKSRAYPSVALGALVLCAVHSAVDFSFEMPANALVLIALITVGLGSSIEQRSAP